MEQNITIKCRKCRSIITKIAEKNLFDAHSNRFINNPADIQSACPTIHGRTEVYLNEEALEQWIQDEIENSGWTKGKLKCAKCASNVGSFDFVSCQKCDCNLFNQPQVHLIRSKIDLEEIKQN